MYHAVDHQLGLPVAGLYGLDYGAYVGAAQVGGQPGVAADAALQLLARVAARETEVDERTRRQRARALGREGPLAVEGVVDVDAAAVAVCSYGDSAAQVGDYQVQGLVGGAMLAGIAACYGALVQGMPGGDARQQRRTGNACGGVQLVHHAGIGRQGTASRQTRGKVGGDAASQVARMVAHGVLYFAEHDVVDGIDAALHGLQQTAAGHNGVKSEGNAVAGELVEDEVAAEFKLVRHQFKRLEVGYRVADVAREHGCHVVEDSYFGRGGTRIDGEESHGVQLEDRVLRQAMARLYSLPRGESPREGRTTGAVVPMSMPALMAPAKVVTVL